MTVYKPTKAIARKVLATVDAGLVNGLGEPKLGQMCVEAAVCYAFGLPHSDTPPCVGSAVRRFKIRLNDARWSSDAARTKGLRALAIAQLGSNEIDQRAFADMVVKATIQKLLPVVLLDAAKSNPRHVEALTKAAARCKKEGTHEAALAAKFAAADADDAAAAYAAAYAADAADAAAADAADAADADAADKYLTICAKIGLDALRKLKSPGCKWLGLLKEGRK